MKQLILTALFSILNINVIFAYDSLISSIDFENRPSIDYYSKLFVDNDFFAYNDTMRYDGVPKYSRTFHQNGRSEYDVTLHYTPLSRHVYNASYKVSVNKEPFVSELMKFYIEIINKYGLPDSAYFRPEDSYYMSSDKNEYFSVNLIGGNDTTKIKQFIEQSKPFGVIWAKDRFYVNLEVREEYSTRYYTDFFCSITDNKTEKIYIEEMDKIKENTLSKERQNTLISAVVLVVCGIMFFFIAKKGYKNIKCDCQIFIFDKKEYDFSDILSCSLYDENHKDIPPTQVTRTNTGSMLGRAAVGGLTLGVAGAVVGAMTAKTESTSSVDSSYISSYVVKIGIKSIEKPTMILKYGSDKAKAEEVYALMQAIIAMK